jgi:hypothetical protein
MKASTAAGSRRTSMLVRVVASLTAIAIASHAHSQESSPPPAPSPESAAPTPAPSPESPAAAPPETPSPQGAGDATTAPSPPPGAMATAPAGFAFTDGRPDKEKKDRELSVWATSCDFGTQDLGDKFVDRVGQLRHDLIAAFGDRLANHTLVIEHYHLYLNTHAMMAANNLGTAVFGFLAVGAGANKKTSRPQCDRDKMAGWFDAHELTTPWSPFIVEIEARLDGQLYKARAVHSPPKNMPAPGIVGPNDFQAEEAAIHAVVDKANAALIEVLRAQLPAAPAAVAAAS